MKEQSMFEKFMSSVASGKPTLLLITAANCKPCEQVKPNFESIASVFEDQLDTYQIDVKDMPVEYLQTRRLQGAPTLLMYSFGVEEHRLSTSEQFAKMGMQVSDFVNRYAQQNMGGASQDFECEACQ